MIVKVLAQTLADNTVQVVRAVEDAVRDAAVVLERVAAVVLVRVQAARLAVDVRDAVTDVEQDVIPDVRAHVKRPVSGNVSAHVFRRVQANQQLKS